MTTVAKEITALLTQANTTRSIPPLRQAFNMLKQLLEQAVVLDAGHCGDAPNDLYLFCCEAAINLEDWDVAATCLDRLLEGTVTSKAYQVRTLFCRAQLESRAVRGLRCKELVQGVHSALMKLVRGLKIALGDTNQLSHLILLGTQHIWNVCKPLFKEGSYGELVGTLGFVVYALEKIDCGDWCVRIVWMLRQANALAQSGRAVDANALMMRTAELAAKYVPAWKYPIFRMQITISKLIPNPKLKQDAAKGLLRGVYAAQALLCGLVEPQAAEADIVGAINELSADMRIDTKDAASPGKGGKDGKPSPPPPKVSASKGAAEVPSAEELQMREECLAELAFAVSLIGDSPKANDTAALALTFKPMKARIYAEYAQAQLQALRCGGIAIQDELHSNTLTPAMAADLVAAVRTIDRALESAVRIGDQLERNHIVQQGCVLLWNIALPLLQPSLRSQIARSLQQAAKYLDDIGSNMNLLRTLLNLESALTDLDADYLGKALARVNKALSIDYFVDLEEMALYALQRPLDRYLVWLKRRLSVRSNMYLKPDNPEDEALLVVEQARDSNLLSKLSMLTKASKILQNSEPPANYFVEAQKVQTVAETKGPGGKPVPPPKKGAAAGKTDAEQAAEADKFKDSLNPKLEEHRVHLRSRMAVWHMILESAWVEKSPMQLANMRGAAAALLARQWSRKSDRDMRHMQAGAYLKLAEGAVVELQAKGLEAAQLTFAADSDSDDDEGDTAAGGRDVGQAETEAEAAQQAAATAQRVALVESAQVELQTSIVNAAKIGMELCQQGFDDQWIVYNACTLLWNIHVQAFKRNDFLAPAMAIDQLYAILMVVGADPKKETALLSDVAFTYVRGLLQQYAQDKMPKAALKVQVLAQNLHQFKVIEANNPKLVKAWEVCDKMTNTLVTPMDAKNFLMASANIQRLQGKPMDNRSHPQQRVLITIDQVNHPIATEEKRNLVGLAVDLLAQDPNVELCARLAERALAIPNCEKHVLRICAIGQSLYNDGKLGWKQNKLGATAADTKPGKGPKGAAAAAIVDAPLSPRSTPPPKPEDWHWYALMLQYQGIATDMLVNPQVQDKQTQSEIRRQALVTLTNSALAAGQGPVTRRGDLVLKALRLYRSICQPFVADAPSRNYMLPSLRMLASEKVLAGVTLPVVRKGTTAIVATDTDVLADLLLILVTCLKDAGELQEGLSTMKQALKVLPASHHKPFWSLDIELRCCANIPTNQTLLRIKEYDPEVQAQVWVTLARFAKSEQDQIFALRSAINVLESKPTEQAAHVLMLAQWMLEHNYNITLENFTTLVLGACGLVTTLSDGVEDDETLSDTGSMRSRGESIKADKLFGTFSERRGTTTSGSVSKPATLGGKRREKNATKGDIRAFLTAIQAHYLLAKVNGHGSGAEEGTDTRSSLQLLLHYVMRLWGSNAVAVNQFMLKRHAKTQKEEALAATAVVQTTATATTGKPNRAASFAATQLVGGPPLTFVPKDPPAPIVVPSTPQGWISFQLPGDFAESLKQMRHPAVVSPSTIAMPEAVVDMLLDAVSMMVREGLELQAHPLLALAALITDTCLPVDAASQSAQLLNTLRRGDALNMASCTALGMLFAVVNPATPALEQATLSEDAKAAQSRVGGLPAPDAAVQRPVVPVQSQRSVHKQWIGICEVLLLEGRLSTVRDLVAAAHAHAVAYRDDAAISRCLFVKAKIFALEGYFAEALAAVQDALQANRSVCGHGWVELKLFECTQLVLLSRFEAAFAAEEMVQQTLASQPILATNIARQLAERLIPELQCIFSSRFASTVLRALTANSADVQVQLKKLLANSVTRAVEQAASCPQLRHLGLLLQVEFSAVEAEYLRRGCQFADLKKRLSTDARALVEAADSIRSRLVAMSGSLSTLTTVQRTSQDMQLSRVLCSLGHNVVDRVRMNVKLLQIFRKSSETGVDYPTTSAVALEEHVVDFMRSSKKQRDADIRKKKVMAVREGIEEQRKVIRAARQAEIDKRRELRRVEEAAIAAETKPGGKAAKGKQAAKVSANAVASTEEPDVSPNDKCGLDSPRNSDDDGGGEDSMSDEDEELRMALKHVDGTDEIHLTYADALDHFNAAVVAACPDTAEWLQARYGAGRAMLLMYEAMAGSVDQRSALVRGEPLPSVETSAVVQSKWNRHIDVAEEVVVDTKGKGGKGREEPKKPPAKGAAAALPVSPTAVAVEVPKVSEGDVLLQQAVSTIEASVRKFHSDDNLESLAAALSDFARVLVLKDQFAAAAQALECAQAAKMALYVLELWATAVPPQSTEAGLLRLLKDIRTGSPHCLRSSQYAEIVRSLYQSSRMLSRLRIPELPTAGEQKEPATFSTDTCTLTLTSDVREGVLYAVFRRHTGQVDMRRCEVRLAVIEELKQDLAGVHAARGALFTTGKVDHELAEEVSSQAKDIVTKLSVFLAPVLAPFGPLFAACTKNHLVLLVDPILLPLPVDAIPTLGKFRSVARDLAVHVVAAKLARRASERFACTSPNFIVDAFKESPTALSALFGNDEKPKTAGWQLLTSVLDENKFLRPLNVAVATRNIANPNASVLINVGSGRLSSTIPLSILSALQLEHLRVALLLDRGVNDGAIRRESQVDMKKGPAAIWAEAPWNVAILLLARGVDCCFVSMAPQLPAVNEAFGRLAISNIDKVGQTKNFAEFFGAVLHDDRGSSRVGEHELLFGDRISYATFGICGDDGSGGAAKK